MDDEPAEQDGREDRPTIQKRTLKLASRLSHACGADARLRSLAGGGFRIEVRSGAFPDDLHELLSEADEYRSWTKTGNCALDGMVWCKILREEEPSRVEWMPCKPVDSYQFVPVVGPDGVATTVEVATNLPGRVAIRNANGALQSVVMSTEAWQSLVAAIGLGNLDGLG
ncbi:hypothetical protein [Kitasatospora griseola]|uniref:hypothetical protein n=1 Tax=Kitasatospora griseola TaxID=2064 RepID=UPI0037F7B700